MLRSIGVIFSLIILAGGLLVACGSFQSTPTPIALDATPRLPTLEVEMPLTPDPTPVVNTPTPDPDAMPPTEEDEASPVTVTPPTEEDAPSTPETEPTPEAEASPDAEETPEAEVSPDAEETPEAETTAQPEQAPEGEEIAAPDEEELISQGEQVFAANCTTCHQADGQATADYPALDGNEFVTAEDPTPVIEIVLHGQGEMPAFEDTLSNEEITAAISYIRNAWSNDASVISVDQVQEVQGSGVSQ